MVRLVIPLFLISITFYLWYFMHRMHPATWILWGLLMISIATNWVQWSQIKRLEKEIAPVIIRQNIEFFDQAPDERVI